MAGANPQRPGSEGQAASSSSSASLRERMGTLGRELAERERPHAAELVRAREVAEALRARVAEALTAFHEAARAAGAPQLQVVLGEARADDKHLRAVQFDLRRGRHVALVTVKSRGDLSLVGPFRQGKTEGPCQSFPLAAEREIEAALGEFLARFLVEAATP
jgi:hypothetical protein